MQESKVRSYFGFARRAGKLALGVFAASTLRRCELLAVDRSIGKNSRKEVEKLRERFACPLVEFEDLGSLVGREGCKCAAVREANLARAICAEAQGAQ